MRKTSFPNGFCSSRLNGQGGNYVMAICDVGTAVEIAEQEAEDRMREKAIEAHRACCPLNELQCIHRDRDDYTCTYDCRYVTSFIQKLTEQ